MPDYLMVVLSPDGAARSYGMLILEELKKQGQELQVFDCLKWRELLENSLQKHAVEFAVDLMGQALITQLVQYQIKRILVLPLSPVQPFFLNLMGQMGIRRIHWFYEDYRVAHYWRSVAPAYDVFLTMQKGQWLQQLDELKVKHQFLPMAASETCAQEARALTDRAWDFVFVGVASEYRVRTLMEIASWGYKVLVAGESWPVMQGVEHYMPEINWLPEQLSWQLYGNSIFGLALSVEDPSLGNSRSEQQLSPRVYEMIACGCVPVFERLEQVAELLQDIEKIEFDHIAELRQSLGCWNWEFWLNEGMELNQQRLLFKHSWKKRVSELLEYLR